MYDEAKGTVDMQGWVTLTNQTGTTFDSAKTLLVAGSPGNDQQTYNQPYRYGRPVPPPPPPPPVYRGDIQQIGTESANRERLGDFYLYPLAERTTIANAQTKQVSFLDTTGAAARKVYSRTLGWMQNDTDPVKASSAIAFSSSRDGGLGDALPAGTVRFYQRDARGTPQFIGENMIDHTPMGSRMTLRTGDAFDVAVESTLVNRVKIDSEEFVRSEKYRVIRGGQVDEIEIQRAQTFYRTAMRYRVTNARPVPVEVEVTQAGLDQGLGSRDFRVVSESLKGEQDGLDRRRWMVPVPANGTVDLDVIYEARY